MKNLNKNKILNYVENDVKQRINDWINSGGNISDPYVQKQNEYLKQVKNKFNI